MLDADVYIAKMQNDDIIHEYYRRCGYEQAGPNFQVRANTPQTITSLEDLAEKMLASQAWVQLIVCHGDPSRGLLLPLYKQGSGFNSTGQVINDLAALAERSVAMENKDSDLDGRIKNVLGYLGGTRDKLLKLIKLLARLKAEKYFKNIVEIRGCHLAEGDAIFMQDYRRALGTHMFTAPKCRQLFLPINPENPANISQLGKAYMSKNTTMDKLSTSQPPRSKTRRRVFGQIGSTAEEPIIIDVEDKDGHTRVEAHAFMDSPSNASTVARRFIRNWNQAPTGTRNDKFVLPILFDDHEDTYHVPLEWNYVYHLKTVTY